MLRVTGNLTPVSTAPLDAEDVRSLVLPLLDPSQAEELRLRRSVDLGFHREGTGRFRINIHYQRGTLAASIRLLPKSIPTLESLKPAPSARQTRRAAAGLHPGDRADGQR